MNTTPLIALLLVSSATFQVNATAYKTIDVKDGGSLSGKIIFTGTDRAPVIYSITRDQDVCGSGNRQVDFVKVNNGVLSDVVVYLDKVKQGKAFVNSEVGKGNLDQKNCEFTPFLQIMYNNEEISVLNSDSVSHNIHAYEQIGRARKSVFNISQPDKGNLISKKVKLDRGTTMKLECDLHDFMHGFVFVAKNPYFAVVGKDGRYTIDNIPAGRYTVKAWHGTLGTKKSKVNIDAGKVSNVDFEFK